MNYSFDPEARREFVQAVCYYEDCREGLGVEFSREVFSTIQRILHFPVAWAKFSENTRRCLTKRFPYGIVYQVMEREVVIIAIMQLNREPDYWKKRIG